MSTQPDPVLSGIRILAALAWFGATGLGATLMGFPDPHFSLSFWLGAILCWVGGAATIILGQEKIRANEREGIILVVLALAGIFLPVLGYFLARQDAVAKTNASLDYAISLRCLSFSGPIPVDPENPPYIVGITGPIPEPAMVPWPVNISTGFATIETDDFRPKGAFFRSVLKCSIINRGPVPLVDAFFEVGFHWHNLSPTDPDVMLEEDISYLYRPFIVTSFDADGKRADFYVVNFGPSGVTFVLPSHAQVHMVGDPKAGKIKLAWLSQGKTEVVFPPRGMTTKYLPNSLPEIPKLRRPPEKNEREIAPYSQ